MNVFETLFPARTRTRARRREAARSARAGHGGPVRRWTLSGEPLETREMLTISDADIKWTSGADFYIDSTHMAPGQEMLCNYASFQITNVDDGDPTPGESIDVWVKATNFGSPGKISLADDGLMHVGPVVEGGLPGAAFFYLKSTAGEVIGLNESFHIEVYDQKPTALTTPIAQQTFTFGNVYETSQASASKITSVTYDNMNPVVGDDITMYVEGELGNNAEFASFNPATRLSWVPNTFELYKTAVTITITPSNIVAADNQLYFDKLDGPGSKYNQVFKAAYTFHITGSTSGPIYPSPTEFTLQDNNWKHHATMGGVLDIPQVTAKLTIAKTPDTNTVTAGDPSPAKYTITVKNNSTKYGADPVTVTDLWPVGLTQGSFSPSQGTVSSSGGDFTWTIGAIAAGGTVSLDVEYTVPSNAVPTGPTQHYINTATVTSPSDLESPHSDTAETVVVTSADLSITKTDFPDPVTAGGSGYTYTIVVTNNGLSDAKGVQVTDTLPAGFLSTLFTTATGSAAPLGAGPFIWSIGTLAKGASATLVVTYGVDSNVTDGVYTNSATVTSSTYDPIPGNNTATCETTVATSADLSITKTDFPDPVTAGGSGYTYTIVVTNNGLSDAAGVQVTDTLPAGFLSTLFTTTSGSAAPLGAGPFIWSIGTLAKGASATLLVTYSVDSNVTDGVYTNSATVTSTTYDPIPGNNTATCDTTVIAQSKLGISKTGTALYVPGAKITYTIIVSNSQGPLDDMDVHVLDAMPMPLIVSWSWTVSFSPGASVYPGSPTSGSGSIDTRIRLPFGTSATFSIIDAQTSLSANTDIVNTAFAIPSIGGKEVQAQWVTSLPNIPTEGVPALVVGSDDGCNGRPLVTVLDERATFLTSFNPYPDQPSFRGGIRVTSADVTGDGVAEIIVAPSRNYVGEVRVFSRIPAASLNYTLLPEYTFYPFGKTYRGGVEVAAGDFNGDGVNDILCGQSTGLGQVSAFTVTLPPLPPPNPVPPGFHVVSSTPYFSFRGFPAPYAGGVMVGAGDFGTYGANGVKISSVPDGRAEVIVGSNSGMRATVKVFSVFGAPNVTPTLSLIKTILPFASTFRGGVTLSVSPTTQLLAPNLPSNLYIGAGVGGKSLVEVYNGQTWTKSTITAFSSFAKPNARVFAAPVDILRNGIVDDVFGVQGLGGAGGTNGVMPASTGIPKTTSLKPALRIAPIVDSLLLLQQQRRR